MRFLAATMLLVGAGSARADEAKPTPASADAAPAGGFDVEFGGGALIPTGPLADEVSGSLDVGGRFGWSSRIGLGLVLAVDYAPLRQRAQRVDENVDTHLFSGSLAPRFVLGKTFARFWLSAGAGVLVERTQVQVTGGATTTAVESGITVGGQGGLDLLFFGAGGLELAGGYTRGLASIEKVQYLAFTAGLLFTL